MAIEDAIIPVEVVELDLELDPEEAERLAREEDAKRQELKDSLANSIEGKFQERASRRQVKEQQWLRSTQLYYGALSIDSDITKTETPFDKTSNSRRPDINIVRAKCNIAIAQSISMQFGTGDKNWSISPAPAVGSTTNSITADLMSAEISSQLEVSKYPYECRKAMWDRIILGTAVLKGPVNTGVPVRAYTQLEDSDTWVPDISVDYSPTICRVNPWFFYPDETVDASEKLGDTIELHPMSSAELRKYMKHEGFDADAIIEVLEEKPKEYTSNNWKDFANLTASNPYLYDNKYLVLEYHGPITQKQLDQLCIEPTFDAFDDVYYGEVWTCQGKVIRVDLENIEAADCVPYNICPWERDLSSVFGFGVPLMMEDAQRVVNQSWHMILDNSSASSGPQIAMQKQLVEPANGKWEFSPYQIWYITDPQANVDNAIQFFNVPNVTENIVPILQMAMQFAEEESQVPLLQAGLQSPQVADTATGGAMMMQASTTLLDFMSEEWDDKMTGPNIQSMIAWNMQYSTKPEIKGNFQIDVRTSTQYKNKQLYIREMEKLSVEAANNPAMSRWIDQAALQRVRLSMMDIPSKEIIKSPEQVAEEEQNQQPQPDYQLLELQLKDRQLTVEEAKLALESQQIQQREAWEHEERMAAVQARLTESQARVAVSQNEKEIELLKIAQKDSSDSAKILAQMQINKENNQTRAFLTGLQESRKQVETDAYANEVSLAARTGKGV